MDMALVIHTIIGGIIISQGLRMVYNKPSLLVARAVLNIELFHYTENRIFYPKPCLSN